LLRPFRFDLGFLEYQLRRELELAFAVEDASTGGVLRSEWRTGTHKWRYTAVEGWILRCDRRAGDAAGQLSSRGDKGEGGRVYTENVCVIQKVEGVCPDLEMNLLVDREIARYP
jgi:hypothetical protein